MCTVQTCGVLLLVSLFVVAIFAVELQLRKALSTEEQRTGGSMRDTPHWCGDWTPYGNLGNESFYPRMKTAVDEAIPACINTKVGVDYTPRAGALYCSPDLKAFNRTPAVLALDIKYIDSMGRPQYTILSHSRSQANNLLQTAPNLCRYTVGAWEAIFVLDASFDDSLQVLHQILASPLCLDSPMTRARVYVQPLPGILETSSLNLAMSASKPSHFYIQVPADVLVLETGWNRDMARVALEYNDVFSVSGQCGTSIARNVRETVYTMGRCMRQTHTKLLDESESTDTEHAFYVTETNTRGPVLWRADALRELGYLDEVNDFEQDNNDLNRRAFLLRGWYSAYKYVHSYTLDLETAAIDDFDEESWLDRYVWKHFKQTSTGVALTPLTALNLPERTHQSLSLYRHSRSDQKEIECDTTFDETLSGYFHPYHLQAEKRSLKLEYDLNDPLPPLPAMVE